VENIKLNTAISDSSKKKPTAYLSFEISSAVDRSSFLETPGGLIHTDVIGSKEDGLISFLFKRADNIELKPLSTTYTPIDIPYNTKGIRISEYYLSDAVCYTAKDTKKLRARTIETNVPCFRIFKPWNSPAFNEI
jgi:hypothetical protein